MLKASSSSSHECFLTYLWQSSFEFFFSDLDKTRSLKIGSPLKSGLTRSGWNFELLHFMPHPRHHMSLSPALRVWKNKLENIYIGDNGDQKFCSQLLIQVLVRDRAHVLTTDLGSLIGNTQCGNICIFLPLRFYVKSILVILKP